MQKIIQTHKVRAHSLSETKTAILLNTMHDILQLLTSLITIIIYNVNVTIALENLQYNPPVKNSGNAAFSKLHDISCQCSSFVRKYISDLDNKNTSHNLTNCRQKS